MYFVCLLCLDIIMICIICFFFCLINLKSSLSQFLALRNYHLFMLLIINHILSKINMVQINDTCENIVVYKLFVGRSFFYDLFLIVMQNFIFNQMVNQQNKSQDIRLFIS